jgi:hypothetical protein
MVRPSHAAVPDPLGSPGPRGLPESPPALLGVRRPRTSQSSRKARRPWSQLSGPGRMPRHPEGEGEITDCRRQGPGHSSRRYPCLYVPTEAPGPTSGAGRTRRWGQIPASCRVDSSFPPGKGTDVLSPIAGSPRGPSSTHTVRVRRFRFLSYSSPSCGSGGSDSASPSILQHPRC